LGNRNRVLQRVHTVSHWHRLQERASELFRMIYLHRHFAFACQLCWKRVPFCTSIHVGPGGDSAAFMDGRLHAAGDTLTRMLVSLYVIDKIKRNGGRSQIIVSEDLSKGYHDTYICSIILLVFFHGTRSLLAH
jgi:hypothetical protein